jgi:3-mercaptopyruvate sulfurtransferase SseA
MRLGHLPGAVNHWWQDDLETVGFGGSSAGRQPAGWYAAEGIVPDRDIILYCNSATEASHVFSR